MTVKTRTIPGYFGKVAPDNLYAAVSSMTYDKFMPPYLPEEPWVQMHIDTSALRGASVNVPLSGTESITSENGMGKENPCYHTRVVGVNRPFLSYTGSYTGGTQRYLQAYYRLATTYSPIALLQPVVDFRSAKSRAYQNMRPRFEGDVSMLNFLYELKDFRDIAKALPKAYKGLGRAWNDAVNHVRRNKHLRDEVLVSAMENNNPRAHKYYNNVLNKNHRYYDRLKDTASSFQPSLIAADLWLINAFAIQPLLKDITSMLSQATIAAHEAQQAFKDASTQEQSSHYSENIVHEDSGVVGGKNYYYRKTGVFRRSVYTATCKYTYDYTMRSRKDAFMRYWGLSGSIEALWNATPWSFLVDYVYTVGKSIHAMERDPNVNWHLKTWLDTIKYTHGQGIFINGDPRAKVFVVDGVYYTPTRAHGLLLTGVEGSIYNRKVSQPMVGIAVPKMRGPSVQQWLNVAALARCFF